MVRSSSSRVDQIRQTVLDLFVNIFVTGLVKMTFIEMKQPPDHLQEMEYDRKKTPQLLEFAVAETVAAVNDIGVK